MMEELDGKAKEVKTKEDFIDFVSLLVTDYRNNPGEWENKDLESFLGALQSWVEDMEGYYINNRIPLPSNINWNIFADILLGARIYE